MAKKRKIQNKSSCRPLLRVEGFELVDPQGRKRATLSAADGVPILIFYDERKKIRFWLTLDANGTPDLRCYGPDGKPCTILRSPTGSR